MTVDDVLKWIRACDNPYELDAMEMPKRQNVLGGVMSFCRDGVFMDLDNPVLKERYREER